MLSDFLSAGVRTLICLVSLFLSCVETDAPKLLPIVYTPQMNAQSARVLWQHQIASDWSLQTHRSYRASQSYDYYWQYATPILRLSPWN